MATFAFSLSSRSTLIAAAAATGAVVLTLRLLRARRQGGERVTIGPKATDLLRANHAQIKILFEQFEKAVSPEEQRAIAQEAMRDLRNHLSLEEEIFYPALRADLNADDAVFASAAADGLELQAVIADLQRPDVDETSLADRFRDVIHHMRAHILETEAVLLPAAERSNLDLSVLGAEMARRQWALEREIAQPAAS